uniref:Uncharacterized protein n=1 Tax=Downingia elegans TaxID=104522 RepID=A0A1Z2QT85_9ASTR|nr:hypothetical protein Do_ele1Pt0605 [Downingia elegans]ASA34694.1 hypothetical protein Do_ele1Pt0605 [Downingia elegans]
MFKQLEPKVTALIIDVQPNLYLARLYLRYLLRWGLENKSFRHRIALTYLFNKGLGSTFLVDRLALTYVLNGGLKKPSWVARLVRAYLRKTGLTKHSIFDTMARALNTLLEEKPSNFFDKMARMYFVARSHESIEKGMFVSAWRDVFELGKVEGRNFIDRNLKTIRRSPRAWETAKILVTMRLRKDLTEINPDEFEEHAGLGYWAGALVRLYTLEKE